MQPPLRLLCEFVAAVETAADVQRGRLRLFPAMSAATDGDARGSINAPLTPPLVARLPTRRESTLPPLVREWCV